VNGFRFSREPAAWGAVVATTVSLLAVFDFPLLQTVHAEAIIAVVDALVGLVIAARVWPPAPSAITYLITAAGVVAAAYGLHIGGDTIAALNVAVPAFIFAMTRLQQSPKAAPSGTPEQIVSTKRV
jgi:hypothetical protein